MFIETEGTPNPATLKFLPGRAVMPAGTADYVVYGLNEQLDYCFTVAVVYTVDHVAASPQLCTKRH